MPRDVRVPRCLALLATLLLSAATAAWAEDATDLAEFVNPLIGVLDGHTSNCTVGPQLPYGSVNPGPQTPNGHHDGYSFTDPIRGFGQLHASGTGWGKYGQILVSPQVGLDVSEIGHDSPKSNEAAKAYSYSVRLDRYGIKAELAPTRHAVIYRFTYPKSDASHLLVDVSHSIAQHIATLMKGKVHAGEVRIEPAAQDGGDKITGFGRYSGGFGSGEYAIYFCAITSKAATTRRTWKNGEVLDQPQASIGQLNDQIGAVVGFETRDQEPIFLKIGMSLKSVEQAEKWLAAEIPGWDFDAVQQNARRAWNRELGKIVVEGGSTKDKTLFYTALFRSMMMPRDRTNDLQGYPEDTPLWDDHYAVWDTWRTAFPLMVLINPRKVTDNVNAFIARFKHKGLVKDAFIAGRDLSHDQGGNDVNNVIADAFVKHVPGVDWQQAYALLKFDADTQRLGVQKSYAKKNLDPVMASYKSKGWIPAGKMSCSLTLEYAYNDFCVAEVARGLGKDADYETYLARSHKWTELWNRDMESRGFTGFICPKTENGQWAEIDPTVRAGSWKDYFYEASSWTYSYFTPHDFPRLVELCGGPAKFAERLEYGLKNRLIDYGNEPAFLAVHSFHYADRPDLAAYWTKKTMRGKFTEKGYPGNEDSGAMASWYVFAALGFFPNAGQPIYFLNGPAFERITVALGNGKKLTIVANNLSKDNVHVDSCRLNGKLLDRSILAHDALVEGGTLEFTMSAKPAR